MLYEIKDEERGKKRKVIYKQFRKYLQKSASYMPIDALSENKDPNVYTFFPSMPRIDKIHKKQYALYNVRYKFDFYGDLHPGLKFKLSQDYFYVFMMSSR